MMALLAAAPALEAGPALSVAGAAVSVGAQATCSLVHATGSAVGLSASASATAGGTTSSSSSIGAASAAQVGLWPTTGTGTSNTLGVTSTATASCDLTLVPLPQLCESSMEDRSLTTTTYPDDTGLTVYRGRFFQDPQGDVFFAGTKNGASFYKAFDADRNLDFSETTPSDGERSGQSTGCPEVTVTMSGQGTARNSYLSFA